MIRVFVFLRRCRPGLKREFQKKTQRRGCVLRARTGAGRDSGVLFALWLTCACVFLHEQRYAICCAAR
jgi:hypothetical protein